ncbi:MAG: leucine-rich repeat protein [Firmicutes bacterium]|nr:leucine-rich repeat protein [Bacillota bacterium]
MSYCNEEQTKQDIADAERLIESGKTNIALLEGQLNVLNTAHKFHKDSENQLLVRQVHSTIKTLTAYINSIKNPIDEDLCYAKLRNICFMSREEQIRACKEWAFQGWCEGAYRLCELYTAGSIVIGQGHSCEETENIPENFDVDKAIEFYEMGRLLGGSSDILTRRIAHTYRLLGNEEMANQWEDKNRNADKASEETSEERSEEPRLTRELWDKAVAHKENGEIEKAVSILVKYQNCADVNYLLGEIYEDKMDYETAAKYYEAVTPIIPNVLDAQAKLGEFYEQGKGVRKDYSKALYWYKKCAGTTILWGDSDFIVWSAMKKIIYFYENGMGVEKNAEKADEWRQVLSESGYLPNYSDEFYVERKVLTRYSGDDKYIFIPDGIVAIEDYAFNFDDDNGENIVYVKIPASVKRIGNSAFYGCKNLEKVDIEGAGLEEIGNSAFYGCKNLKSFSIPASVTHIGSDAFSYVGCEIIAKAWRSAPADWAEDWEGYGKSQVIFDEMTSGDKTLVCIDCNRSFIFSKAEQDLYKQKNIRQENLCSACLKNRQFTIENGVLVKYTGGGGVVEIPQGVTRISASVFNKREDITSISLPSTLESIGESAFAFCKGLQSIVIPNSVTQVEKWAFAGCQALKSIQFSNKMSVIEFNVFAETAVEKLEIPDNIKLIETSAFQQNAKLTSVALPENLTKIGGGAFSFCERLTDIVIPKKLRILGCNAFGECKNINSITIPSAVEHVDYKAFAGWEKHQTIYYQKTNSLSWNKKWKKDCKAKLVTI